MLCECGVCLLLLVNYIVVWCGLFCIYVVFYVFVVAFVFYHVLYVVLFEHYKTINMIIILCFFHSFSTTFSLMAVKPAPFGIVTSVDAAASVSTNKKVRV